MSRPLAVLALALVVVGSAIGCADRLPPVDTGTVVLDFVADFELVEPSGERGRLRAAGPEFARRLRGGWGEVETGTAGDTFRWMLGQRAEFDLFSTRPRKLTLICRCTAFSWPGAPEQRLALEVGGVSVESVAVPGAGSGDSEVRLEIPAAALRAGWNRLHLEASRATAPSAVLADNADARPLAIRVEALEFRGLVDAESPSVRSGKLRLPLGSSVRAFGEAADDLHWALGEVRAEGGAQLGVYLHSATGRSVLVPGATRLPAGSGLAVELVAEAIDRPWWRRWLGPERADGALWIDGAQLRSTGSASASPASADLPVPEEGSLPGVIVYMIDTLRADRVGVYGSDLGLTPNLDRLAEASVVFTDARAQSSWTRPSVVSVFTGLYPQSHGVEERDDGLAPTVTTVAERLHAAGVATGGYVTNGNISQAFGLGKGFADYQHLREDTGRESVHVLADELNRWGLHWLERHEEENPNQPFFLYLHATDPHAPYTPAEPFASRFAAGADRELGRLETLRRLHAGAPAAPGDRDQMLALYDAEVAWTDHQLGVFIEALQARDLWRHTLFVVVSDHGEEFLDHDGWEHGHTLYDEQLRMPLVVKLPEGVGAARRVAGPAGHVDLMPTILDALGVSFERDAIDGRSLWPALTGVSHESGGAVALSHLELADRSLRGLVLDRWKLIEDLKRARGDLFDLPEDPAELRDLSQADPLRTGLLRQERRRLERDLKAGAATADAVDLDDETRKQLEALGYGG